MIGDNHKNISDYSGKRSLCTATDINKQYQFVVV